MRYIEQLTEAAGRLGAYKCGSVAVDQIPFDRGLRKNCEMNYCGAFGKNWMCPPSCGDIDALIARAKTFETLFLFQTVYPLEDSYDIEGMNEAGKRHNELVEALSHTARALLPSCQMLGAGGCRLCERCAKATDEPCRFPDRAHPSLEAYGIYVAGLASKCGMQYINGQNTVTYFGAVLF